MLAAPAFFSHPMRRLATALGLGLAILLLLPMRVHAAAAWAVKGASFRIVVRLKDAPENPDTGIEISVPDLNAAGPDGKNYTLTDATGQPLPVTVVWNGEAQNALLLARDLHAGQDYYLYVGGTRGPDWSPKVSLLFETRALSGSRTAFTSASALQQAWTAAPTLGARFVDTIFSSDNPFGEQNNFLAHYTGYLNPPGGDVQFFTNSSDASFVLVNGQLLVDAPGNHPPSGDLKTIHMKKLSAGTDGPVRIDYYSVKAGTEGPPFMTLCWIESGKPAGVPATSWLHPGTSEIIGAETVTGQPVPLPEITLTSYMGSGGSFLYEVHGQLSGSEPKGAVTEWRFDDGGVFTGSQIDRIMSGSPSFQRLTVQTGQNAGAVRVARHLNFAGPPPADASEGKEGRARYLDLLTKADPVHLDAAMLGAALPFLIAHGTDAQVTPYAVDWLRLRPPSADSRWLPAELARLRSIAVTDPAAALAALRADTEGRTRYARQLDLFEIELMVFYQHDLASAARIQQMAFSLGDSPEGRIAAIRLGDLYRLNGDARQATLKYEASQPPDPSNGRQLPAEDQANSITLQSLIDQGDRDAAMDKLTAWELAHPMTKFTSDFLLLRSHTLTLYGRWREALAELAAFPSTHPDSPYQMEVDFNRARCLYELGRKDDARKVWLDLTKNFPKSKFAASSKQWAAKP